MSTFVSSSDDRIVYRYNDLARKLGVCTRTLDRERSAGRFPQPDQRIGRCLLYKPQTIQAWLNGQKTETGKRSNRAT